jgi:hypothetical protein
VICAIIGRAVGIAPSLIRPLTPSLQLCDRFLHQVGFGEDAARMGEHDLALLGQALEAPAALDDQHAELFLQLHDRRRQGRLRDMAGLRRPAKMFFTSKRVEINQLADDHG